MAKKTKNNNKNNRNNTRTAKPRVVRTFREGRILSVEMFKRHAWFILIVVVSIIALMGQRYTNQTKMLKIKQLDKELTLEQSIHINEKANYMSLIRENEMRKLLREKHLDLDYQEQPPYKISQE